MLTLLRHTLTIAAALALMAGTAQDLCAQKWRKEKKAQETVSVDDIRAGHKTEGMNSKAKAQSGRDFLP